MKRTDIEQTRQTSLPLILGRDPLLPSTKPSFEAFKAYTATAGICLDANSPRNLEQLYGDIYEEREASIIVEDGQKKRYGRVAVIDVYYKADDGRVYKLKEERFKVKQGRKMDEFLNGDETAVIPSPARPALNSISERMGLNGEKPKDAVARALREELFDHVLENQPESERRRVEQLLRKVPTVSSKPQRVERGPAVIGNSYLGLHSVYDEYAAHVVFTPDMRLPIVDDKGYLQPLYECIPDKGYINRFTWEVIESLPVQIKPVRARFASQPR